jgi:hypothetical protein
MQNRIIPIQEMSQALAAPVYIRQQNNVSDHNKVIVAIKIQWQWSSWQTHRYQIRRIAFQQILEGIFCTLSADGLWRSRGLVIRHQAVILRPNRLQAWIPEDMDDLQLETWTTSRLKQLRITILPGHVETP